MNKWRGSYTVEAVFVMTISIFVIMTICYMAMFMHDKAVALSYSRYQVECCLQDGQSLDVAESEIKKSLEGRLFLIRIQNVSIKKQILSRKITMVYTLSLSIPLLRIALVGKDDKAEFVLEHGYIRSAALMWDSAVWDEGGLHSED